MTRNASLIHLEARRAPRRVLWKKGEGSSDRFMETAAFLSSLSFFFFPFAFFFETRRGERRINDWLEIYEKDRKIIPFSGDSNREGRIKDEDSRANV